VARPFQIAKPWLPAIAYMALIAIASSQSGHSIELDYIPLRDKGVHFVEFAVLAILIARALFRSGIARPWKIAVWTIGLSTLWGYLDEVHQAFVPGRTADAWDVLADFLGSIAGAAIYLALSSAIARRRSKLAP